MADSAPTPLRMKLAWAGAGLLCAAVLTVLWITAHRVKEAKLRARAGEPAPHRVPVEGPLALTLVPDRAVSVEHFTLRLDREGRIAVRDARGRRVVDFTQLAPGEVRRWQELKLTIGARKAGGLELSGEIEPGATCFGAGRYRYLKPGLTIAVSDDARLQILDADLRLRIRDPSLSGEMAFPVEADLDLGGMVLRVVRENGAPILEVAKK